MLIVNMRVHAFCIEKANRIIRSIYYMETEQLCSVASYNITLFDNIVSMSVTVYIYIAGYTYALRFCSRGVL